MIFGYSSKKCGLLGEHLTHSFSPVIHNLIADYSYELFEASPDNLEAFVRSNSFDFINVTIPYKKAVIPYLDEISNEAKAIGAVNLVINKNEKLYGYNTDYFGFEYMIDSANIHVNGKKVIVLGMGGAAATIFTVLQNKGVKEIVSVNRQNNNHEFLSQHTDAEVIINATPVGMYPNNGATPTDLSLFPSCKAVLDIVYNPLRTELMLEAERRNVTTVSGLSMLVAQAVRAFEIFSGSKCDNKTIEEIISKIAKKTQNIILIGMPSCGKSTVGRILAESLNRKFFDADEEFEKTYGISPATAINTLGEEKFREMEQDVLATLGKMSSSVIATGGGAVTRKANYPSLHQNGVIFYIKRDISQLSAEGRPLSVANSLETLFNKRKPLYESFADIETDSQDTPQNTANKIKTEFEKINFSYLTEKKEQI